MSANVETAVYANTPAWHREGVVLDTEGALGITVPVALEQSGLDWSVEKVPVYASIPVIKDSSQQMVQIENKWAVQRSTDHKILGVVGNSWTPVQNTEGFEIIEEVMQGADVYIEAAGALDGGKKVWVLAHCVQELQIAGEDVSTYILFTNGHDGRTSVTAAMTDVRVVCQNTLTWALQDATRIHRVRHTTRAAARLAEAKHILGLRDLRSEQLARQGEWLVQQEMPDSEFEKFLNELMPIKEEGTPAATMTTQRRDEVTDVYRNVDNLNDIRGTRWGALNAVVEYADYRRKFKDGNTQMRAQFLDQAIKQRAVDLLTADAPLTIA